MSVAVGSPFHSRWASALATWLKSGRLPPGHFAAVQLHVGPRLEVDVGTVRQNGGGPPGASPTHEPAVATAVRAPPTPAMIMPGVCPDEIAVGLHTGREPWDAQRTLADLFEVPAARAVSGASILVPTVADLFFGELPTDVADRLRKFSQAARKVLPLGRTEAALWLDFVIGADRARIVIDEARLVAWLVYETWR